MMVDHENARDASKARFFDLAASLVGPNRK
jgi:hypothetical protein